MTVVEKMLKPRTKEYIEWLYQFIKPNKIYDDDAMDKNLYTSDDWDNLSLISSFQVFIQNLANEQHIPNITDENNEFQALNFIFHYKDRFYQIDTMIGQGGRTYIEMVEQNKVNRKYVELDGVYEK